MTCHAHAPPRDHPEPFTNPTDPRLPDPRLPAAPTPGSTTRSGPWWWLVGSAVLFFLVPFVGTDLLGLQPDLYYVVLLHRRGRVVRRVPRHVRREPCATCGAPTWGGAWSSVRSPASVWSASCSRRAGTGHPDGWRWWFGIGWRGVVYGSVDTVVLFVFPAAVAYLVLHGNRAGAARKVGYAALVLALSLVMSTAYHLGYPEYRDADLRSPLVGTVMANSAAVVTGNPVGAFLTHVPAHISAAVHQNRGRSDPHAAAPDHGGLPRPR